MHTFRRGDRGDAVRDVQSRLVALSFSVHPTELQRAEFGPSTEAAVRTFQQERGLLVDGLVGPDTWEELVEAGYALGDRVLYLRRPSVRGDDVRTLQARLNLLGFDPGREDGIFGEQTSTAVHQFQLNVGLVPDGLVGATTVQALDRLIRSPGRGPGRTAVREEETMRVPSGSLAGRAIALDPGHGPGDAGATGPGGLVEADVAFAIVERLARELEARGARPFVLRSRGEDPPLSERASRANAVEAEALVSIHLNSHDDPGAEGSSSYYFGRFESGSVAGQALAELVQDELTAATGLRDGRTHPKSFPILRETRMPAVQIEPCFITNPREEELLRRDAFVANVARAVTRALERFLAGRDTRGRAENGG